MPESRHKYLFERLGDHDFQQLVSALLSHQFRDFVPMALRQADGGRDGILREQPDKVLIYQVKWSVSGSEKDPVTWIDDVVRKEAANLTRLAQEGVRRYIIVTNVGSTSRAGKGTYDRLDLKLQEHAKSFGLDQMSCVWREGLNPWVDNAPVETKWAYAEMLAGWDLIRYLIAEHVGSAKDKGLRRLVRRVATQQWYEDERVKFSQADVDRERVIDLFVDVTADCVRSPFPRAGATSGSTTIGGAAGHILGSPTPFTLVRGAPGQGKSTLTQYVCQAHRAAFVDEALRPAALPTMPSPRFPIRVDLSDYAQWLSGADVWEASDDPKPRRKKRPAAQSTLEWYLADLLSHLSGDRTVTAAELHEVFERVPTLIVLDGLDEVGSPSIRSRVVKAIDALARSANAYDNDPPKLIVTTRPSAGELPEPSSDLFEVLALNPLTIEQRADYLRKWCGTRGIHGKDGRGLRKSFNERSQEPYIEELAGNPMQLTILLDLLHRQGAATPTQRTDLYDQYVDLLLAREANKHPEVVKKHRDELLEIIPFLGWYLHAHTEESQVNGRMSVAELQEAMRHFQRAYGNPETIVDELFEAASDRLWALTSKVDGTFEFEVLSLREYFAARFLYRNAGEDIPGFDSSSVVRELLRRPYWLNTARFYGGNAKGNGVYTLTAAIEDELAGGASDAAVLAAWTLLTDGAFLRRPREARRVLTALCSDDAIPVLLSAMDRRDIPPLPELPNLPKNDGPDPTWDRLTSGMLADPSAPENPQRMRALRELLGLRNEFADWWCDQLRTLAGTTKQSSWLQLGALCEAAAGRLLDPQLQLGPGDAEAILSAGLTTATESDAEAALLNAVTNGECPNVTSTRSYPAQVAVALAPSHFLTSSKEGFMELPDKPRRRRQDAMNQLRKSRSIFHSAAPHRPVKSGEKGSTFPWANTAMTLFQDVGRSWLASEIAIIGAASPFRDGYQRKPGRSAFGREGHPCELMAQSRAAAGKAAWWREELPDPEDFLGRSEWGLALWCVAKGDVIQELLPFWWDVVSALPEHHQRVISRAAAQIGQFGWLEVRPVANTVRDVALSDLIESRIPRTGLSTPSSAPSRAYGRSSASTSLLAVARAERWLKVDSTPAYR